MRIKDEQQQAAQAAGAQPSTDGVRGCLHIPAHQWGCLFVVLQVPIVARGWSHKTEMPVL